MSEATVQRCAVQGAPTGWPQLHVLVATHHESTTLAAGRDAARQRMRALLLQHAGPQIAAPLLATARAASGARRASISHDHTVSLLAWCAHGCIGIDAIHPQRLAAMAPDELVATAALYLGPLAATAVRQAPAAPQARAVFAEAWACHEAKLKCLGLALDEWSPAVQAQLAGCTTVGVAPPGGGGTLAAPWVARLAWRGWLGAAEPIGLAPTARPPAHCAAKR